MTTDELVETAPRVALLARQGAACDRLLAALREAGADVVLVSDPAQTDVASVRQAGAGAILIALEPAVEEALDRFDALLADPAITVIFDEAELAAQREGWDAARWARHLAAKLNRHQQVLPPGAEIDAALAAVAPPPARYERPDSDGDIEAFATKADLLALDLPRDFGAASSAQTASMFDPVAHEAGSILDPGALDIGALDVGALDVGAMVEPITQESASLQDPLAGLEATLDFAPVAPAEPASMFDPVAHEAAAMAEPVLHHQAASMFDPVLAELDTYAAPEPSGLGDLALEPVAEPASDDADTHHRFRRDLDDLQLRIADMQLEDARLPRSSPLGAVVVLAGLGGPDAVRQLLGDLPANFPRPVLIQQRLEGGRHDKLVRQMQRATTMPVALAEPGLAVAAGHVYMLPAELGLASGAEGLQFKAVGDAGVGDALFAHLPAADSAVVLLSGSDPASVDAAMNHAVHGALVAGQAADGCFDAVAASALVARGAESGTPAQLAKKLATRWPSTV